MRFFYIEYSMFFEDDYDENDSTIIEAKNKKQAVVKLKQNTSDENYKKIVVDTIYETTSDARSK